MHIFEIYDGLRNQKNLNVCLDGDKSLRRLASFVAGYEAGANAENKKLIGFEDIRNFNSWVAKQLHYAEPTSGWCNMILSKAKSDEEAFDLFFELLDKYRKDQGN